MRIGHSGCTSWLVRVFELVLALRSSGPQISSPVRPGISRTNHKTDLRLEMTSGIEEAVSKSCLRHPLSPEGTPGRLRRSCSLASKRYPAPVPLSAEQNLLVWIAAPL